MLFDDAVSTLGGGASTSLHNAPRITGRLRLPISKPTTTSSPTSGMKYAPRPPPAMKVATRAGADGASWLPLR